MTTPTPQDMERALAVVAKWDADDRAKLCDLIAQAIADERERCAKDDAALRIARICGRLEGAYWAFGIATQSRDYLSVAVSAAKIAHPDEGWDSFERDTEAGRAWAKMVEESGAAIRSGGSHA